MNIPRPQMFLRGRYQASNLRRTLSSQASTGTVARDNFWLIFKRTNAGIFVYLLVYNEEEFAMFSEEEIRKLREKRFVLDGMAVTLTNVGDSGDKYHGSGFVRQTSEGNLEYTVYDQDRDSGLRSNVRLAPGLILEDEFYDFQLTDHSGACLA